MTDAPSDLPPGVRVVEGQTFLIGPKGELLPPSTVKDQYKLEDQLVRRLADDADRMSAELKAFKEASFAEVDALNALLEERYGAKARIGGAKGNSTFQTIDGLVRVQVQTADLIQFGPELQAAKALMDECVKDWMLTSNAELCALVTKAFRVDREGNINRGALLSLQQVEWKDERAIRAMEAIKDSIRVVGSKRYFRVSRRANPQAAWVNISLDVANA